MLLNAVIVFLRAYSSDVVRFNAGEAAVLIVGTHWLTPHIVSTKTSA